MFGFQPVPIDDDSSGGGPPPGGCAVLSSSTYGGKNTSHSITLPSGITVGDKILIILAYDIYTPTGLSGYTFLRGSSAVLNMETYLRTATGSEGSTLSLTTSGTCNVTAICYRISCGHAGSGNTNYGNGDTASFSAPSSVSGDVLELASVGWIDGREETTYTNGYIEYREGYASNSASSDSVTIEAGWKTISSSGSETPGTLTITGSVDWATIVEVFH